MTAPPKSAIRKPPTGFAIVAMVGPAMVWCAEYIGSGEVILATRTGAILGTTVLWAVVSGIFLKYWIGMSGARYTVCTGEGMMDMFARMPGPRNWAVWIVLVAQLAMAAISIGSVAAAAAAFLSAVVPISSYAAGWIITVFCVAVVWSGRFDSLKMVMSLFVLVILLGVGFVAVSVFPDLNTFLRGLVPGIVQVPAWAIAQGIDSNPWREILPLLGWGAGGFASQVWYTYWVLGAGYGAAEGREYGKPADAEALRRMTPEDARSIAGWCRVVYADATLAVVIGIVVTASFVIAGAGVLGARELAPTGNDVAFTLSNLFSTQWGQMGGTLFLIGGIAALVSTQVGQLAGWPRLIADGFRHCIPGFAQRFEWKWQFRIFLLLFCLTNMVIVFTFGYRPVFLVQLGATLDGLLLTPLQALWVGLGLYVVLPKLYNKEAYAAIRPHWIFGLGLLIAFLVFGYFCVVQLPQTFR